MTTLQSKPLLLAVCVASISSMPVSAIAKTKNTTDSVDSSKQTDNADKEPTDSSQTLTQLPASIQRQLSKAGVPLSAMSVIVQEVGQPKPLLSYLPHKKRLPASTLKIVTTFAALDKLGPNFRWVNRLYHTGYIKDGTLHGDLIIKGSGDPKLVREYIESIYALVHSKGVKHITGNIILDSSVFGKVRHNPAAFDNEPLRPYNASPDGLLVNFKSVIFKFFPEPDSGIARIESEPAMSDVSFHTRVILGEGSCGKKAWQKKLQATFTPSTAEFNGYYPRSCGERHWAVAFPTPENYAPRVLKGMWLASGGTVSGKAFYGSKPSSAKLLVSYKSLPLRNIITDINQFSNNVMTEQVFLSLPVYARQGKFTHQGTYGNARRWMTTWWRRNLPKHSPPRMSKASGLCRGCYVPASSLNALLQRAAKHRHAVVFKHSMGIAGQSGTIKSFKYRMPNSPANGNAYIKTGTLDDVTSIAGFVDAKNGKKYTVVGIIHHRSAQRARPALDALMDWTAKQ